MSEPPVYPPSHDGANPGRTPASHAAEPPSSDPYYAHEEGPAPLGAAVEATTGWLKKVSHATTERVSTAYAAAARSDSEEAAMAAASTHAPPVTPMPQAGAWAGEPVAASVPREAFDTAGPPVGARRVRLVIARVDPWSAMKLSFLMSFALGIMSVVSAATMWLALDGLQVFAKIEELVSQVASPEGAVQVMSYFGFGKVVASAMLIGVVDVFLLTALGTIAAFLYNVVAALVGGVHVSVTDE
ncbi:MAG: DUF3566 domain-containing protein [Micrococcales bacterium]|nr:DUF3566 domain-containing protein [Micrococcales bacterium]MCL2666300.1 DUF3566 domain-containing protein [Micrococcales bacterium]